MTIDSETGKNFDHLEVFDQQQEHVLAELATRRSECPLQHTDAHGGFWALFDYSTISEVARDTEHFSSIGGVVIPPHGFPMELPPIEADPPEHGQFRGPMLRHFSPAAVEKLAGPMREMVVELIGRFETKGVADLAKELNIPFPGMTIGLIMGVSPDEIEKLKGWTYKLMLDLSDLEAIGEALAFFDDLYTRRVAEPADDFPSTVLELVINDEPVTHEQFLAIMAMVTFAGLETTANSASHIFDVLDQQPELRKLLADQPDRIPNAIEELLRYISPLPASSRTTKCPVDLGDTQLGAGERILMNWMAANHDPVEFESPGTIDIDRFPNRHYVFGAGPHRCLGLHLARVQLRIMVKEVLARLPDYEIERTGIERYIGVTRGIAALPITFTPS